MGNTEEAQGQETQTISPLVDLTLKPQQETQICSFRVEKD